MSTRFSMSEMDVDWKMSALPHGTRCSSAAPAPAKRCACTGLNSRYDATPDVRSASTISPPHSSSCGVRSMLKRCDSASSSAGGALSTPPSPKMWTSRGASLTCATRTSSRLPSAAASGAPSGTVAAEPAPSHAAKSLSVNEAAREP